jgi:hypothetical protein
MVERGVRPYRSNGECRCQCDKLSSGRGKLTVLVRPVPPVPKHLPCALLAARYGSPKRLPSTRGQTLRPAYLSYHLVVKREPVPFWWKCMFSLHERHEEKQTVSADGPTLLDTQVGHALQTIACAVSTCILK